MIGWLVIQNSFLVNDINSLGAEQHTQNAHMLTSQRKYISRKQASGQRTPDLIIKSN